MSIIDYDGKIMRFLNTFWSIIWINILWLVTSIPLLTLGASTTAAYYTMVKCVRKDTGYVTKEFFHSFRTNFKQATLLELFFLVIGGILAADCWFFYHSDLGFAIFGLWLSYALCAVLLSMMNFAFPWLSRFEMKFSSLIRTSISLVFVNIIFALALLLTDFLLVFGLYMCPWGIVVFPGFKCFLDTLIIEPVIKKYLPKTITEESK